MYYRFSTSFNPPHLTTPIRFFFYFVQITLLISPMHTNSFCVIIHEKVSSEHSLIFSKFVRGYHIEVNSFVQGIFFEWWHTYELEIDWKSIQFSINFFLNVYSKLKQTEMEKAFSCFIMFDQIFLCASMEKVFHFFFFFGKRKQIEKHHFQLWVFLYRNSEFGR